MEKNFAQMFAEEARNSNNDAYEARQKRLIAEKLFQIKLEENAKAYVEYVKRKASEEADRGCGSIQITIDNTFDNWGVDEGFAYESRTVETLIRSEGFTFDSSEDEDHTDAVTTILVWDKRLPRSNERIGMRPS